jgi:hypothetical protein
MDDEGNTKSLIPRHIDILNTGLFTRLFTMFRVASPRTLRLQFYSFRVRNTVFEL